MMKWILEIEKNNRMIGFKTLKGAMEIGIMWLQTRGEDISIINAETGEIVLRYANNDCYVAESLKYEF